MIKPIFILSLPRSGSTLLQRILSTHDSVNSAPEPWILLPLVYAYKTYGIVGEYNCSVGQKAVNEFFNSIENGEKIYKKHIKALTADLYAAHAGKEAKYFIDKTPRYSLIGQDILDIYGQDAKYIILTRNPLSIASSMINSWGRQGEWNLYRYEIDFFSGIESMYQVANQFRDYTYHVSYEELVTNPSEVIKGICDYLEIDFQQEMTSQFSNVDLSAGYGDKTGIKKYTKISQDSLTGWKNTFRGYFRYMWVKRLKATVCDEALEYFGLSNRDYEYVRSNRNLHNIVIDALKIIFGLGVRYANTDLFFKKRRSKRGYSSYE